MLGFAGHRVSVPSIYHHNCSGESNFRQYVKTTSDNMYINGYGYVPIKFYLQKQAQAISGYNFPTPVISIAHFAVNLKPKDKLKCMTFVLPSLPAT